LLLLVEESRGEILTDITALGNAAPYVTVPVPEDAVPSPNFMIRPFGKVTLSVPV
jgi:hypothetical protein